MGKKGGGKGEMRMGKMGKGKGEKWELKLSYIRVQ
jgi:hypothetical protein